MDKPERHELLRTNPERYATTGLDWGNAGHHEAIANGLFQALMGVLARQQGVFVMAERRVLQSQQVRVEQRLSVAERAIWRNGGLNPRRMEDQVVVYGLEKMADAFEDGAMAWRRSKAENGSNVLAGTMLGVGVGFAAAVRGQGALSRFSVGPFGGLSRVAALVTRLDVGLEMEDLPALDALVQKARAIPVGHVVDHANKTSVAFCEAVDQLQARLQARDQDRRWNS